LLVIILLFAVTACGTGGEKVDSDIVNELDNIYTNNLEESQSEEISIKEEKQEEGSLAELPLTASFPMYNVYIDGPNWQFIEKGSTSLYNVGGKRFIALTSSEYVEANEITEIIDAYFKEFKSAVGTNCNGYKPEKFNVEGKEVEINGRNFWRFEGELIAKMPSQETSFYTVGYTFFWEDRPFQLTGVVVSEEQAQEEIDEIRTYVDEMIKTIRDER
ncbi:MAG TPA: hypothetical protein PKK61_12215, partial [Defluviitaleaceae bacterium]|nr:hypothetical protein [Defluviitaleaceae bacterium]